ncbi:unnamed protein product [Schistosoma mansoni]|uniref:Smp_202310 n=1 Tax=Schistosoma mansoni TaxID=6183 RepID=UPI00022C8557|nr:unnamed protein product [Schistosoma mansoni]|eukprot:XP_018645410.1 unnamed protein product [Schistosoma mansoni]
MRLLLNGWLKSEKKFTKLYENLLCNSIEVMNVVLSIIVHYKFVVECSLINNNNNNEVLTSYVMTINIYDIMMKQVKLFSQ